MCEEYHVLLCLCLKTRYRKAHVCPLFDFKWDTFRHCERHTILRLFKEAVIESDALLCLCLKIADFSDMFVPSGSN
jgi:hypothetical protein